jgi:Tol biopolymer transport system component
MTRLISILMSLFAALILVSVVGARLIGDSIRPDDRLRVVYLAYNSTPIRIYRSPPVPARMLISEVGGTHTRQLVSPQYVHRWEFAVSPDGTMVVMSYGHWNRGGDHWTTAVDLLDLRTTKRLRLQDCDLCRTLRWSPNSRHLAFLNLDRTLTGTRISVFDLPSRQNTMFQADSSPDSDQFRWTNDNQLLITTNTFGDPMTITHALDPQTGATEPTDNRLPPLQSPDQQLRALFYMAANREQSLLIENRAGEVVQQFPLGDDLYAELMWEADNEHLTVARSINPASDPHFSIYRLGIDGVLQPLTRATEAGVNHLPVMWSADGRYLLFFRQPVNQRGGGDLWLYDDHDESIRPALGNPPAAVDSASFVPPGSGG